MSNNLGKFSSNVVFGQEISVSFTTGKRKVRYWETGKRMVVKRETTTIKIKSINKGNGFNYSETITYNPDDTKSFCWAKKFLFTKFCAFFNRNVRTRLWKSYFNRFPTEKIKRDV